MVNNKVKTIEEQPSGDVTSALREGDLYFARQGRVWTAFRRIAHHLAARQLPYVEIGGLAMFQCGFRQYTETIDLLLSAPGYEALCNDFQGFKETNEPWTFIEAESGIRVSIKLEGQHAGSGVRFPNPATTAQIKHGLRFIHLSDLVSLKLARVIQQQRSVTRELAAVQELILVLGLSQEFAATLYPQVRDTYRRICGEIDAGCGVFLLLWETGSPVSQIPTFDEMVAADPMQAVILREMERAGVTICTTRPSYKGHAVLSTTNRLIARKYDMHHESEYWFTDDS